MKNTKIKFGIFLALMVITAADVVVYIQLISAKEATVWFFTLIGFGALIAITFSALGWVFFLLLFRYFLEE